MSGEDVSVRARFERFPATVKGAFVVRGEGADPHQVAFREARVVSVAGRSGFAIPMKPALIDVPPHQDMFLPFEFSVAELEPGWYSLECDVDVDGSPRSVEGGRRFAVQWPRATVRRGSVVIGRKASLGSMTVKLEQIDCSADHCLLRYEVKPPEPVVLKLSADGERMAELESDFDDATGRGSLRVYPLLRVHGALRIQAAARGKGSAEVEVSLR